MANNEKNIASFDEKWEELHRNMEWGKYPNEEVIRFVARNLYSKDRKNTKILDVGCGAGNVVWYLSREGFDTYGFDGSLSAIKKAEERMKIENLKADLQVSDAVNMPYEDECFDAVIDSAMIYANTIENIKKILKECYRVLKKDGKLFSTGLFSTDMTGYGTGDEIEKNTYRKVTQGSLANRGTVHFFDREEIEEYWNEIGFKNIKIDFLLRTDHGGENKVTYFMVEAKK